MTETTRTWTTTREREIERDALLARMAEQVELLVLACRLNVPEILPEDVQPDTEEVYT
jgi:hypothetical protein